MIDALRRLDPLLDIIWNPKARLVKPGWYNAEAGKRHDPEYDGRWNVIRWDTPGLHAGRQYVVICEVTEPVRAGKNRILMMQDGGAYAPVGEWLVEFMQTWDAAQRAFAARMDEAWQEHEKTDTLALEGAIKDRDAHLEAAERVYAKAAGPYWMGGAQGKAHPVTEATLFGKGRKSSTAGATSSGES